MKTVFVILVVAALICFLYTVITSKNSDPDERVREAATAAGGGAVVAFGCLCQLLIPVGFLLLGFWLFKKIFL